MPQPADHFVLPDLYAVLSFRGGQNFPRLGQEIDRAVSKYVHVMETWVVRYLDWSFASKRYFGEISEEFEETMIVKLFPCCSRNR